MNAYLGIDVGTSSTKVIAIRAQGTILAESSVHYPCQHPQPLWSEQDPELWWRATVRAVRAVMKQSRLRPPQVRAIGLSGQMHGSVFLDRHDQVIRPALLWNDQRTSAECAEIEMRAGGREKLIDMVANPALTGFTAPKILWLRNHEPRNFEKLARVLLPKDDVRRRLTGVYATDMSDASGMLLLDVAGRQWSRPLLDRLQLDPQLLPQLYESEEVTGNLTAQAARQLGLTKECLVVAGAGDCAANGIGTGIVRRGDLSTSIGTSGVVFVHSDQMQVDPAGRLHTFCHAVRGKWHMMGVSLTAGGSLEWFVQQLCPELWQRRAAKDPYQVLMAEANRVPAGSEGLFFLPYLAGERTPHANPRARGCFIGLTLKHQRGHVTRAILEGVCYALRDSLEIIRSLDVPVKNIRVSGGGAKSPLWRQLQADILGQKVFTINAEQGPAFGVALLAAVGGGEYSHITEACRATIRTTSETQVQRSVRQRYQQAFPIYQQLYRSVQPDFERIAAL